MGVDSGQEVIFEVIFMWLLSLASLNSFSPSMYQTKAVILAMIITAVVSISVTIFCFQTKVRIWRVLP
jgi:hypothetical protein